MAEFALGVNNTWAAKRFVEPEVWVELAATRMDIAYVQFSLDLVDLNAEDAVIGDLVARTRDSCRKYGVQLESCFTGLITYNTNHLLHPSEGMRETAFKWYAKALSLCRDLGGEAVGGHMGALTVKDYGDMVKRDSLISELIERVKSLSEMGKKLGLRMILWEPMPVPREPPSTILEAQTLLARVNENASFSIPVRLCIDVGHACNPAAPDSRDRDPYSWVDDLGSLSPYVHLQQTDGKGDRHWPFTDSYNKNGIITGEKLIDALEKSGASKAYLFLEVVPAFEQNDDQVIDDMVRSVRYWKEYL